MEDYKEGETVASTRVYLVKVKLDLLIPNIIPIFGNKINLGYRVEVCIPMLVLNETRQDWTSYPELAVLRKDYFFLVPLLKKIWEKSVK